MKSSFVEIAPETLGDNAIKLIGSDWMLISAGTSQSYNMMTASWGGLGVLWGQPVAYVFIRPGRLTRQFVDNSELFTLSFFDKEYREVLNLCGQKSGREIDKMNLPGLDSMQTPNGSVAFEQARLVLECKKLYFQDITPEQFLSPEIETWYPEKDYHRMYIGQILSCLEAR